MTELIQLLSTILNPSNNNIASIGIICLFMIIHSTIFPNLYHSIYCYCIPKRIKPFLTYYKWINCTAILFRWFSSLLLLSFIPVIFYASSVNNPILLNYYSLLLLLNIVLFSVKIILFNVKKPRITKTQFIQNRCSKSNPLSLFSEFICSILLSLCVKETFHITQNFLRRVILFIIIYPYIILPLFCQLNRLDWNLAMQKIKQSIQQFIQFIQFFFRNKKN